MTNFVVDMTIPVIKDAPGPDDDLDAIKAHAKEINGIRACYNFDRIRAVCYWCLTDDLLFTDKGVRQGTYKWCSERCRDANGKLMESYKQGVSN